MSMSHAEQMNGKSTGVSPAVAHQAKLYGRNRVKLVSVVKRAGLLPRRGMFSYN